MAILTFRRSALALVGLLCMAAATVPGCGGSPTSPSKPPGVSAASAYVVSVSPAVAPAGQRVTISATGGFRQGATATFGGVSATVVEVTAGAIVAITPDHAAGVVPVVVSNPERDHLFTGSFTYVPFRIDRLDPPGFGYAGLQLFVFGSGFVSGAKLRLGGMEVPGTVSQGGPFAASSFRTIVPAHPPGVFDLVFENPGGPSITLSGGWTFLRLPILTVSPTSVAAGGQLTVSWDLPVEAPLQWVALYRVGASNFDYLDWQYVGGETGSTQFTAPSQPGQYEFRYLPLDGFQDFARTSVITVTANEASAADRPVSNESCGGL